MGLGYNGDWTRGEEIETVNIKSSFQKLDYEGGEREREKLEGNEKFLFVF